jgi:hypothetical protein
MGAVAGLIGSVKAASGPTNLFINGSATTATPISFINGEYQRNTTYFKTTPAAWQQNDQGNGPALTYFAASTLTIGNTYSISWWSRSDPLNAPSLNTFAPLSFVGGTGTLTFTPTGTFTYYKLEGMTANSTNAYLKWSNPNNDSTIIDDIWLIAGPTAY